MKTEIERTGIEDETFIDESSRAWSFPGDSSLPVLLSWSLPGHGASLPSCGEIGYCTHHAVPRPHYRVYRASCSMFECPVCYENWAALEAASIEYRLTAASESRLVRRAPVHVVVSPPKTEWSMTRTVQGYRQLRTAAYLTAKRCGFEGGCAIFHPLRIPGKWNSRVKCAEGPHFHLMGFGWIVGTDREYEDSGWIVRNLKVRLSVKSTAHYLLSHAGKGVYELPVDGYPALEKSKRGLDVVTWFGVCAYNNLKVPEMPPGDIFCPVCKEMVPYGQWYRALYVGEGPPPTEKEGSGECLPDEWIIEDATEGWGHCLRVIL